MHTKIINSSYGGHYDPNDRLLLNVLHVRMRALGCLLRRRERALMFKETCAKCQGTGCWMVQNAFGRMVPRNNREGDSTCFECKGKGFKEFKTSRADRAEARAKASNRKEAKAKENVERAKAYYVDEIEFLQARIDRSDFFASLLASLGKYGDFTEKQLEAVRKAMQRVALTSAQIEARTEVVGSGISIINEKFATASSKIKAPRLHMVTEANLRITIKPAKKDSRILYVTTEGDHYLGKVQDGSFIPSFLNVQNVDENMHADIVKALSDPSTATVRYGRVTGCCGVCGRELTTNESIERGIGPVCAENYGL